LWSEGYYDANPTLDQKEEKDYWERKKMPSYVISTTLRRGTSYGQRNITPLPKKQRPSRGRGKGVSGEGYSLMGLLKKGLDPPGMGDRC